MRPLIGFWMLLWFLSAAPGLAFADNGPQAVMATVVTSLSHGQYATALPLLSDRSQRALVATFSHTYGVSVDVAYQSLTQGAADAVTLWRQVLTAIQLPPQIRYDTTVTAGHTAVWVVFDQYRRAFQVVDENGNRIALIESVLPSWLNVAPVDRAWPTTASWWGIVQLLEMDAISDLGIPTPPPDNCDVPTGPVYVNPGIRVF